MSAARGDLRQTGGPQTVLRRFTLFVAVMVFFLLIAGALVTSTQSGLAVPDWPLSYGRLMPPMVGGILYEHGHRMIAAAVSTLVGLQLLLFWLRSKEPSHVRLAAWAFGAILAQAVLGGVTVLLLLPPAVSSAHAGLAQIVFALTAVLALRTRPAWDALGATRPDAAEEPALRSARRLALAAAGATYVQILLGAIVRHTGAGLAVPDFPTSFGGLLPSAEQWSLRGVPAQMAHRAGFVVVTVLVLAASAALFRLRSWSQARSIAALWTSLLAAQISFGALSIWTLKSPHVTTAHLAGGALLWVTGLLTALSLRRIGALEAASLPAPASPVESA